MCLFGLFSWNPRILDKVALICKLALWGVKFLRARIKQEFSSRYLWLIVNLVNLNKFQSYFCLHQVLLQFANNTIKSVRYVLFPSYLTLIVASSNLIHKKPISDIDSSVRNCPFKSIISFSCPFKSLISF